LSATKGKARKLDLSAVKTAVEAAIKDNSGGELEDVILRAASALPSEASDFDRGMAAGFAAAVILELKSPDEIGISQIN
jgi:hypothetical protein